MIKETRVKSKSGSRRHKNGCTVNLARLFGEVVYTTQHILKASH